MTQRLSLSEIIDLAINLQEGIQAILGLVANEFSGEFQGDKVRVGILYVATKMESEINQINDGLALATVAPAEECVA